MSTVPVDFPGAIYPQTNPPTPPPHLDTDPPSDIVTPTGATMSIENYHAPRITKAPSTDYERIENAPLGHPEMPAIPKHSRVVHYPTGHIVAFPDHLPPEEFDKAAKQAWKKIKQ
jgi:hypothetical protein